MSVFVSFLNLIVSLMTVYVANIYYQQHLSEQSLTYNQYTKAYKFLQQILMDVTDLDMHHFHPCKTCGYYLALLRDDQYCEKSDVYKLLHPKTVLEQTHVFRDYAGNDLARKLIQQEMYDSIPRFFQTGRTNITFLSKLPETTSLIYPYAKNYFRTHTLGRQAGCMFQKYFHVPGQEEIALKSNQSNHFSNYIKKMQNQGKPNYCINDASYQKPTFRMWNEKECKDFFEIIDSQEYQNELRSNGIQYIFKTNRHLGNGILLLDIQNEKTIRTWYRDGQICGVNQSQVIIQEYVRNPYLYNGHKMEFRSYFQIASTNPPTLYGYKKALIKQCGLKFNLKDFTKEAHVCNTAVTKKLKENEKMSQQLYFQFFKDEDDDLYIDWNLEELQELLLSEGRINSTNWLNEFLYPQIFKKVAHLYFSVKDLIFTDSRVGEFFGVDFIMDNDLRLWILECNRNPNFLAVTEGRKEKFGKLIPDQLNIQMQYVRSRYKRISSYIDNKILPLMRTNDKELQKRKGEIKLEFLDLFKDRLEPEFELEKNSLAVLIQVIDKDISEKYKIKNIIEEECRLD